MSIGTGMSLTDGIDCVRNRLDVYENEIVSDLYISSDSEGDRVVSRNCIVLFQFKL